jgi:putative transcriptional regulator
MKPTHHLSDEWLIDYAAGTAPEPVSVLVATHLALCPDCRASYRRLEAIGGALLELASPVAVGAAARESVLARLDDPAPIPAAAPTPTANSPSQLPRPLRDCVPNGLAALPWQRLGRGAAIAWLRCASTTPYKMLMLRIAAGGSVPWHTHRGNELVLVLQGAYVDHLGRFGPGDVAIADDTIDHRPIADKGEDCFCLAVVDAPIRFTGVFSRLLNPLLRR